MLGMPGKMDIYGHMVQDMFNEGRMQDISDYCRCDVLDTYFVFLRVAVLLGWLDFETEQQIVDETKKWLEDRVESTPIYGDYLAQCVKVPNPFALPVESQSASLLAESDMVPVDEATDPPNASSPQ